MLLIFTGNGKGKTTAALGQAMRALGDDERALIVQFIKGLWISGEDHFISKFNIPNSKFKIVKGGLGFVGILGDTRPIEEHRKAAEDTWELAKGEVVSGKWDLVVLDEINNALHLNLLNIDDVVNFIAKIKKDGIGVDVILTGRDADERLMEIADIVTEMREIKHPYQKGEEAKKGIEF